MVEIVPASELPKQDVNALTWKQLSVLPDEETYHIAQNIVESKPEADSLTKNEMYVVIRALPLSGEPKKDRIMKKEMDFGIKFLHMLLDKEGVPEVLKFSRDANRVIREEEGLYDYDFGETAHKALTGARRRHLLKEFGLSMGTGWFAAGLGTAAVGGLDTMDDVLDIASSPRPSDQVTVPGPLFAARKHVRKLSRTADARVADPVETLIGGLLIAEGVKGWKEKREEQIDEISDTVSELSKYYPELKKDLHTASLRRSSKASGR